MKWKEDFIISLKDRRYQEGLRSLSGKYVEHLAGFTLKGIANTATYGNAMQLIAQSCTVAVDMSVSDALTRMQCLGQSKIIAVSLPVLWTTTYADDYQPTIGEFEVVKLHPQYQPLSTWRITKINLLTNDTVTGKTLTLIDGNETINFTVDLVAGQITSIDLTSPDGTLGYLVRNNAGFKISWDLSDIRPANWDWSNNSNCGCSGNKTSVFGRWYYVNGNQSGISVDMSYICDYSRLEQNIAFIMSQAILYRLGIQLCDEIIASDRINFFVNNSVDWAEKRKEEFQQAYDKELEKILPSLNNVVRTIDRNCFDTRRNVFTEMRI